MTGRHEETEPRGPEEPVVVRDRRRIDPDTGQVRQPLAPEPAPEPGPQQGEPQHAAPPHPAPQNAMPSLDESIVDESVAVASDAEKQLAERTADLQRLQAEYANYRKRVDRDREQVVIGAKASLVNDLLPLLDDLERADQHGDLTGAFKAVGDKLVSGLQRAGLEWFGSAGEPFDPSVHEAVQHSTSPDVAGPTVTMVMRRGYRIGERVLRAALVGVTDHEPGTDAPLDSVVEGELPLDVEFVDESQQ